MENSLITFLLVNIDKSLIFGICFLILIIILYIISFFLKNPLNISIGPIKLFMGTKKNEKSVKDDIYLIDKIKSIICEYKKEIIDLKYDTLRRQLTFAEEKVNDIKSLMSETYSGLLKLKLPIDQQEYVKSHEQYKNYQMLIKIALNECIITLMKKSFKENHLDEMVSIEWGNYIKHKTDTGIQHISEFLDLMYGNSFIVTRQELSEANNKHVEEFYKLVKNVFENGKEIQIKNNKKSEQLKDEMDKKIEELIN